MCAAQLRPEDNTVAIVAYWQPGDQLVLKSGITRSKVNPDGTSEVTAQALQTITLRVLEETEKTYIVRISYSDILNSGTEGNIVNELAAAISGNITYDIETDQLGVVQRLYNPEQTLKAMRDKVPALVDGVLAKYDKKTIAEQGVDRDDIVARFSGIFDDVSFISENYNKYLLPLFRYHGHRFTLDHEYVDDMNYYDVLDLGTLDLDTTYYFDSEDTDKYYTYVGSLAVADKEQMKPYAEALDADDLELTFEEVSSLKIDLNTGWPNDLYNKRTVHMFDPETGEKMDLVWETGVTDRRNIGK